eukprot:Platyproteum_vivax@DN9078_c0_g1_i1.p1
METTFSATNGLPPCTRARAAGMHRPITAQIPSLSPQSPLQERTCRYSHRVIGRECQLQTSTRLQRAFKLQTAIAAVKHKQIAQLANAIKHTAQDVAMQQVLSL